MRLKHSVWGGEIPEFKVKIGGFIVDTGFLCADVLKMVIEVAEQEVFGYRTDWFPMVQWMAYELHGWGCEAAVSGAVVGQVHALKKSGELNLFRRSSAVLVDA